MPFREILSNESRHCGTIKNAVMALYARGTSSTLDGDAAAALLKLSEAGRPAGLP